MFGKTNLFEQASGLLGQRRFFSTRLSKDPKIIASIGLTKDEVTVLASMVSIVAIKTQGQWQLGNIDNADIFFVDVESKEGRRFARRHDGKLPIIKYGKHSDSSGLAKPLRARDLLAAFKEIDEREDVSREDSRGGGLRNSA